MSPAEKPYSVVGMKPYMVRVILATMPCVAGAVYFYGWRCLALVAVSCLFAYATEYLFCRIRGEPVSEAVFVTAILYSLTMPPTVPWHVLIVGIVFAIAFAKQAFGGFGRNMFNPALFGRCFVYSCFPVAMTARWAPAAQGPLGALTQWTTAMSPDAITSASPMTLAKLGQAAPPALADLMIGRISGTMGATSALLILIGGAYLFYTRTANRSLIVTSILTYGVLYEVLHLLGVDHFYDGLTALMSCGFLFGTFFMITDPVTAPKTPLARIIYAILVAVLAVVLRNYSLFNDGYMFAILLGNMFVPILDYSMNQHNKKTISRASRQTA